MKRNLLYNFLLISLVIHLLLVLPGFADFGHRNVQHAEPLVVDITGPVYAAPKNLPQPARKEEPGKPSEPVKETASNPPLLSSELTVPVTEKAVQPQQAPTQPPVKTSEGKTAEGLNGSSPADVQGISECTRSLVSQADLMRYAEAEEAHQRDYLITSYLNRLSSLMDRRMDNLLKYSGSRTNDPAVEFTIKSGALDRMAIVRSSGNEKLDDAVMQVLMDVSPYNPLPGIWKGQDISFVATINIY